MKKKIYLAGGWFTPEQEEEHSRIYNCLKDDYDVVNPKLASLITPGCTDDFMTQTLKGNIENIKNADIVVVIYDYRDTGTIWEAGFAYANKKPIIYYAEKNGNKPFNLMLAKTGRVAKTMSELILLLQNDEIYNWQETYAYAGIIE